jgi:polar amino acid transport system permease protein
MSWFDLFFGPKGWAPLMVQGAAITIALAVVTMPFGFSTGLGVALLKVSKRRWIRGCADAFTTVFRGIPDLLALFIVYYGLQAIIDRLTRLGMPHIELSAFAAGVIALSVVVAAYSSEVWVAALQAVPPSQAEAGRSLGLGAKVIFLKITLPQMLRVAIPGLSNIWTILLKDTSLISTLAVLDLLRAASIASQNTTRPLLFYTAAAMVYLVISIIASLIQGRIEMHLRKGMA